MKSSLAGLAIWTATALLLCCAEIPVTTLLLPHAPKDKEAVFLEVKLGSLARGRRVEIETPSGRLLGAISPFGNREPGTTTVPIPADAVSGDRVPIRIFVNDGRERRAPASGEIRSIAAKVSAPESP